MSRIDWLVQPRPRPDADWQLFCLPPAGGGTATYAGWAAAFGPGIEVTSVCLPGRERNLAVGPYDEMARLAAELADVVRAAGRGPFALFGHSFGAALAYAVATHLGPHAGPDHLFVSSCGAPHLTRQWCRSTPMTDDELVRVLRSHGGVPDGLLDVPDLLELVLPALRADLTASAAYRPDPGAAVSCAITAIGGRTDPAVQAADLDRWQDLTTGRFERRELPGGHFYLTDQLPEVVATVRHGLAAVTSPVHHRSNPRVQGARS